MHLRHNLGVFRELARAAIASFRASPENPSTNLSNPAEWLVDYFGGGKSKAGVAISYQTALTISAYFACIRILSETMASLPLILMERQDDGGRTRAREHPLFMKLHDEPNPLMSSFTFIETMQAHVSSQGNAYAKIVTDGAGRVRDLWPIPPTHIEPRLDDDGSLHYVMTRPWPYETGRILLPNQVLHIPGLGYDGIKGYNVVTLARESLGLSKAAEEMGASLFGNGIVPSGTLSTEANLDDTQAARLIRQFETSHTEHGKTMLLAGGLKWEAVAISPENAQFLETRKFQVSDVARWFRIPPHMIGDLERATFSNIEHQAIEFVQHTIRPWTVRWEREINRKLLTPSERMRYFVEFNVDGLLRGDFKTRMEGMVRAAGGPIWTPNEARVMDNLPKMDGYDEIRTPVNMTTEPEGAGANSEGAAA